MTRRVADYVRAYRNFLRPEFGPRPANDIGELEWQMWCGRLSREGLSRSRISTLVAIASAIDAWAMTPTRRYATRNPLRLIELPPNDERPRLRVAFAAEAEQLLAALEPEDALPYAIAFYAGLRRSEIHRLEWPDVLDARRIASRLLVARSKSDAGTERRPPIAELTERSMTRPDEWWSAPGAAREVVVPGPPDSTSQSLPPTSTSSPSQPYEGGTGTNSCDFESSGDTGNGCGP